MGEWELSFVIFFVLCDQFWLSKGQNLKVNNATM